MVSINRQNQYDPTPQEMREMKMRCLDIASRLVPDMNTQSKKEDTLKIAEELYAYITS